ncbi:MAG: SPASM domain-containing protein, partial [Bacteroidales bacterium]|nr:SPASM domain-containing protein [Bacteroidales bacterium]
SMSGNKSGTVIAAMMFDMSVYVVSDAALPPSLPVMTAAAVAVGHISMTTMPSSPKIEVLEYNARPTFEEKTKTFEDRSICTGNRSSFFVLPDGKVTLCEQMYWHPFFILGDLFQNSIMEVWNSKKALELASFSKSDVRECSPCKKCDIFDQCRHNIGVCWRDAIAAYGDGNYDYPSPECPYAPQVTNDFYID